MTQLTSYHDILDMDFFGVIQESTRGLSERTAQLHGVLRQYRQRGPVYSGAISREFWDRPTIASMAAEASGSSVVAVLGYAETLSVLRDPATFSAEVYLPSIGQVMGRNILTMDPPDHTKYRGAVQGFFSKRVAESLRVDVIDPVVVKTLEVITGSGRHSANLYPEFAMLYPISVLHGLLGLNEDLDDVYLKLGLSSLLYDSYPEVAFGGAMRLRELLIEDIRSRRDGTYARPGILEDLVGTQIEGSYLSDDEIYPYLAVLLGAGSETTMRSTLNLLLALLTFPDQRALVEQDPSLMPRAIEETLRWEGSTGVVYRQATRDSEIAGVDVPAGTALEIWLASANHDESVFDDPDAFNLQRDAKAHVGFSFGNHLCIGMHIARAETGTAVGRVLEMLPGVKLDPDFPMPRVIGYGFRSAESLPVVF